MLLKKDVKLKVEKNFEHSLPYAYTKTEENDVVFGVVYEEGKGKNEKVMNWSIKPTEFLHPSVLDWYFKVRDVSLDGCEMNFDDVKLKLLFAQIVQLQNAENFIESKRKKKAHWKGW